MTSLRQRVRKALEVAGTKLKWNVDEDDFSDSTANFQNWPKYAYHGTSINSAEVLVKGQKKVRMDFAFDKSIAEYYAGLKGNNLAILKLDISKLTKGGIYYNPDVDEGGFSYEGRLVSGAVKIVYTSIAHTDPVKDDIDIYFNAFYTGNCDAAWQTKYLSKVKSKEHKDYVKKKAKEAMRHVNKSLDDFTKQGNRIGIRTYTNQLKTMQRNFEKTMKYLANV